MRLLLTEDEQRLSTLVAEHLRGVGFVVDVAGSVGDAKALLDLSVYDAVLLDLGLPDGDGLHLLHAMRGRRDATPVLILTARDAVEARVEGLNAGADDYLIKPFALSELVARVRALLRRPGGVLGHHLRVGNVCLDTLERAVSVAGHPLPLTRHELGALECLMRRAGRVVMRETLVDQIYGLDAEPASNPVPVHIHNLRKHLAARQATASIVTFRGLGYLLSAPDEGLT